MGADQVQRAIDAVRELYTANLAEHGTTSKSVGWRDEESQLLRFEKLATVIDGGDDRVEVADWGCGYGAMFNFLAARLGDRLAGYRGYDISEEMVAAAREAVHDERATFVVGDTPHEADYTFVSGTFNVRFEAGDTAWRGWVEDVLRRLWSSSRRGLAFNLLTSYVDWREPHLFYAEPTEFFHFCKGELSPRVALLHDYPLYEWTICVGR
jgi:SAM-dependent methyltransferase